MNHKICLARSIFSDYRIVGSDCHTCDLSLLGSKLQSRPYLLFGAQNVRIGLQYETAGKIYNYCIAVHSLQGNISINLHSYVVMIGWWSTWWSKGDNYRQNDTFAWHEKKRQKNQHKGIVMTIFIQVTFILWVSNLSGFSISKGDFVTLHEQSRLLRL